MFPSVLPRAHELLSQVAANAVMLNAEVRCPHNCLKTPNETRTLEADLVLGNPCPLNYIAVVGVLPD